MQYQKDRPDFSERPFYVWTYFSSFLRFFAVIPNVRMAPIIRNDHPAIGAVSPVPGPLLSPRTPTSGGSASPRTPTSGCTGANASPSTAVAAAAAGAPPAGSSGVGAAAGVWLLVIVKSSITVL